jgi:hypothetical protein
MFDEKSCKGNLVEKAGRMVRMKESWLKGSHEWCE